MNKSPWKPWHKIVLALSVAVLLAAIILATIGCGDSASSRPQQAVASTPMPKPECARPTGQVLACLNE